MHLKQKAYSFGLIYTIITITLYFSAGSCEPTAPSVHPASPSVLYDVGGSFVTTEIHIQPSISPARRWLHLGSKRRDKSSGNLLLQTEGFKNTVERKRDAPEPRLKPRMASSRKTSSKTRFKRRQTERRKHFTSHGFLNGTCNLGHIEHTVPGKFYINGQFGPNLKNLGYHLGSDGPGQGNQVKSRGQQSSGSHESWQRLEPTVECGENAMILTVRRKQAMQLVLDRVNGSSLLFQLPPRCGYFIRITPKDLSLKAQYDACHVTQEDGSHVLPLLWRGIPVKVSCPVSKNKHPGEGPLFLCCFPRGMALKLRGPSADKEPHVNVRGEWNPLSMLANQCGYTVKKRDEEILIFVPFDTCGVTMKDGNHILSLQLRKETFILTCPIQPLEKPPVTNQPLTDNTSFAKRVADHKSLGPLLWIPPFYLAPPNYPHPTYPQPKGHGSYNPSAPMAPGVAFSPQPKNQDYYYNQIPLQETLKPFRTHKPLSSKDQTKNSGRVYKNKQNRKVYDSKVLEKSATTTGFTVQDDFQQPPGHDFSPYYHYYHLPKIPLPGTPQDPGPGAPERLSSSTSSQNHQFSSMPPNFSQFEDASNMISPLIIPAPHTIPTGSKVSSFSASYPLQPFPYYYFLYQPDGAKTEAKRLVLLHPHLAAKTKPNPQMNNIKMDKSVSKLQDGNNGRLFASVTPVVQSPVSQSSSHKPDPLSVPSLEQPFIPTPGFTHNADPYKYYYHPYYNNYLPYYVPEALREKHNLGSPITPRAAASSSVKPSNHNHTPRTESMNDIQKRLLYYYSLYLPQLVKRNQKLHHLDGKKKKRASTKFASLLSPPFDFGETQHTASSVPLSMYVPLQSLYSYFATWQRPSEPSEQHGGKRVKVNLDQEIKDGTAGQIFDLAVPDLVADPSVVPPALSSGDSKRSCRLKKLTSHPDVYIVPLNGCGVNKHKMVNLLDAQGIKSHKVGSFYSPGRSIVGCGSSPDFTGKLRFHMKDQRRPHSAVSVLLRIATDESFSRFYPKAHLPLSLMQTKPVYVELKLLEPSEPSMVLLVHSCLAYTLNPDGSWMRFYDSCSSRGISQLLPSSDSQHIRRIKINGLPSLPSKRFPYSTHVGHWNPEDPEIYILCLTEVCSTVYNDCRVRCGKGPNSDIKAMK